jgi:hypothetical protein
MLLLKGHEALKLLGILRKLVDPLLEVRKQLLRFLALLDCLVELLHHLLFLLVVVPNLQ